MIQENIEEQKFTAEGFPKGAGPVRRDNSSSKPLRVSYMCIFSCTFCSVPPANLTS